MQFADAEHVVTTTVVVMTVLPVKGIVKDIAVGSSTGADVDDVPWPGSFQGETTSIQGSFPNGVACGLDHESALFRILEQQDT